ncbi:MULTISPECIES: P1 family peptidase [unclassified Gordonia (in: high G+C Gram-positive bacteria)]|uniref:P1 family peptidase n=1 Tax=unclassified Gordonia (in: high G+C Gram-positive bacteria) TaxID=2657482 RepID=UPI001F0FCBE9|nr:P1 family peptidase [Gordonia sp. ABSL49_1]MCH5645445.1 P1 family peptidase [Gordonia sp. ABSL49_1]
MSRSREGDRITDVVGLGVGHHHRIESAAGWATGTTVVRLSGVGDRVPMVAVDVRGGGPGTRETDLLDPSNTVQTAHAIVLTGGSAYGLAAADGVMSVLEYEGAGLVMDEAQHTGERSDGAVRVVPIVPAAVIFDLPVGAWHARPNAEFGARAATAAAVDFEVGSVGAGTGARAGALKGGVGTAAVRIADGPAAGVTVGALMVANPVGAVLDPETGLPWDATEAALNQWGLRPPVSAEVATLAELAEKSTVLNTTIGVVATDADLDAAMTRRVAMAAHDGLARAIRPAHSPLDGDTVFAVSTGGVAPPDEQVPVPPGMYPAVAVLSEVCRHAAEVVQRAIVDAVVSATSLAGLPAYRDVAPSAFAPPE